jgi:ABC-type sugar transport system ATPase subunit
MAELELQGITKRFGEITALDNLTMRVPDKSFTALLGLPGAGKTTLLKIVAGVLEADEGRVYLDGIDVSGLPPQKRNVAMVYQSFALYPHMTVYDNVASPLKARKLSRSDIDKKVAEVLKFLNIEKLAGRYPRELSGGEAQRVAIARSLVREASIYLYDEPLTNLDYKLRESARGELKKMCRETGTTILYATPDPLDAISMADYVGIMVKGRIIQFGPTREVYDLPKNIPAASIFGSPPMNFIEGIARMKGDKLVLETPIADIDAKRYGGKLQVGSEYVIALRPHYISFKEKIGEHATSFEAELYLTHVIGSETIGYARANNIELTLHLPYIYRIPKPEKVSLAFSTDKILLYDKETSSLIV